MTRRVSLLAGVPCAAILAASTPALAINLVAGTIDVLGQDATVDLWFFTITGGAPLLTGIQADPIGGPFTTEDMGLLLYREIGGSFGALLGADGAPGGARNARIELNLDPGDYIAVVSSTTLSPGEFGPTQNDPGVSILMNYELTLDQAGGNSSLYSCTIQGDLNGTFSVNKNPQVSPTAADCQLPQSSVPVPGSMALLVPGIVAVGSLRRRKR